ncbi:MAG: hypothetical protein ACYCDN_00035 [Schaalia turicensis]|uniref:hypothetical protein n=1 Tax=Schaalia turicensis TaxID=131111 RepID=UPI001039E9A8|nr:hypothetical protein [Schaalia turicensis]QYB15801.1 hypothetical protein G5S47_02295 [Schaalia turicensis]
MDNFLPLNAFQLFFVTTKALEELKNGVFSKKNDEFEAAHHRLISVIVLACVAKRGSYLLQRAQ